MKRIGERIRNRREFLHLQMNDLAKKVGISTSALSQIENAKTIPSILTLKSIADHLQTTVSELIGENETLSHRPHFKKADRKFVRKNPSGTSLYLLSHHDPHKLMETYLIKIPVGGNIEGIMRIHHGQEFLYVNKGKINLELDGAQYIIDTGDSFYFNSNLPHSMTNSYNKNASVIWIVTPPIP